MSQITKVEIHEFTHSVENLGLLTNANTIGAVGYSKGQSVIMDKYAIVVETSDGCRGEYVTHWGGNQVACSQSKMLAPKLLEYKAEQREKIYDDFKRELRQFDHMGHGPIDIALWDWAGKNLNCSVSFLLGSYRTRLPAYASTYHGDRNGGLDCKEAFADFAEECFGIGYKAFKIHGWHEGNAKEEAENLLYVAKKVGNKMTLMLDPACQLRTFADALYVGKACDDAGFFWLEDPYRDSGVSAFAHNKLRQMIKTPLLQTEHIRGVETKCDFLMAGGTDFLRSDPEYDMGITGAMKIAHLGEAFGIDVEIHACGPAHRHVMATMRNSNFYEVALVGPDCPNTMAPVYTCGYTDMIDCIGKDGCVEVPSGIGLGVSYDWDFIKSNTTNLTIFE
ncbi:enolase C-terminal domain-like protein [Alphaproteobacteria bacterium]|jgi:L-alanine-DL-glutamate epimerase-like enolase superfamily enzyme|nr:enolase C-terminal domain-like protein [Alphaproteobacteria bacterium]|tara:strand:+ start:759 stop:1934 length:1176 start_codon:yes stop_codon:yes gene_type:complete